MSLKQEIVDIQNQLTHLNNKKNKLINVFNSLNIGDTVYDLDDCSVEGGFFPQKVMNIDYENLQLELYESSIDRISFTDQFYIKQDGKFINWTQL